MQNPKMRNSGDGVMRADCGAFFMFNDFANAAVNQKTASATLTAEESGQCYSNGAAVTLTLPVPKPGLWFLFVKAHNSTFTVAASAGTTINGAATLANSTALDVGKGALLVIAISATQWVTFAAGGSTWA